MPSIDIKQIPKDTFNKIFEIMHSDKKLASQLEKIENNANFDDKKKALFIRYRLDLAFWRTAKQVMGQDLPLLEDSEYEHN